MADFSSLAPEPQQQPMQQARDFSSLAPTPAQQQHASISDMLTKIANTSLEGAENFTLGAGDSVRNLMASAANFIPGVNIPMAKSSSGKAYTAGKLSGDVAGFVGGGELLDTARLGAEAAPYIGKAAQYLGGSGWAGVARRALGSAGYGAIESPGNRTEGALQGAALSVAGDTLLGGISSGIKAVKGNKNTTSKAGNWVIDYLKRANEKAGALSPEETADNLATHYTNADGTPMAVDIGTLANNKLLKTLYGAGKYVPFSGASKNINTLKNQLSDKGISDTAKSLEELHSKDIANRATSEGIKNKLSQINDYQARHIDPYIEKAPGYIGELISSVPNKGNINEYLRDSVKNVYNKNKEISRENYAPINNSQIRLDKIAKPQDFENYRKASNDLNIHSDTLKNLFDSGSDLGSRVKAELSKSKQFLSKGQKYAMPLGDVVGRIRNLGKLASAAKSQGNNYEASLLQNLRHGLKADTNNILNKYGHEDIANALSKANKFHEEKITPFWGHSQIRKAVTDKDYVPPENTLTNALHSPIGNEVLNQLPQEAKNTSLFQLATGGKYSSAGKLSLDAKKLGSNYQGIHGDIRSTIASYNPKADAFLEALSSGVSKKNEIQEIRKDLTTQLNNLNKSPESKQIPKTIKQLEDLKKERYGIEKEHGFTGSALEKLAKGGLAAGAGLGALHSGISSALLAGIPISRTLTKALSDPDLIKAYISGNKMAVEKSLKESLIKKAAHSTIPLIMDSQKQPLEITINKPKQGANP